MHVCVYVSICVFAWKYGVTVNTLTVVGCQSGFVAGNVAQNCVKNSICDVCSHPLDRKGGFKGREGKFGSPKRFPLELL